MQESTMSPRKFFLFFALLFFGSGLSAQSLFFNQYQLSPLATNPGQAGMAQGAWVGINYRSVPLHLGEKFTTTQVSALYPIGVGKHRLVLSGSFYSDRVTEFFNTNGGSLGAAVSIALSERSSLSFGTQAVMFGNSLVGDVSTDSQFINGVYDPTASTGERMNGSSRTAVSASSGLYWQLRDDEDRVKAFAGISLFNFTNPEISYSDQNSQKLPATYKATLGYEIFRQGEFAVVPTAQGSVTNGNRLLQAGSLFTYDLMNSDAKQVGLGGWYNANELMVFSVQYQQPALKAALSFELPLSNAYQSAVGSPLEIAIFYRIFKKRKRQAAVGEVESAEPVSRLIEHVGADRPKENTAAVEPRKEPEELPATVQPAIEVVAPLALSAEEEKIVDQNVRFKLDSDILDDPSQEYLDQVAAIFQHHASLHIQLTGHTCNTGSLEVNQSLSLKRAKNVKAYLVNKGIGENRVTTIGMGETEPLTDNSTEALRQLNRRVEIKIVEKND
ncbi:MAG: PorP/SprF family type IX secretion system membrane protein [Imperialibacter sp.]|uniref:PorP/SprF family type IX secretion system membrane protein n=1 Tax=Imperialibacter sp. TaxID=2038411 RepID=UPI003A88C913